LGIQKKQVTVRRVVVESGKLTEGLFGQILIWILEATSEIRKYQIRPDFRIFSENYGSPRTHNIFPSVLRLRHKPVAIQRLPAGLRYAFARENPREIVLSLEKIKEKAANIFCSEEGFQAANSCLHEYFLLPKRILEKKDRLKAKRNMIGIHFRGTDKVVEKTQTNPITQIQFLAFAENLIHWKKPSKIYVASDEPEFVEKMLEKYGNTVFSQRNSANRKINKSAPFRGHPKKCNGRIAREALVDSVMLSRCSIVLQNCSALACFAKIFNPAVTVYRCAAMKQNWFPLAYTEVIPSSVIGIHKETFEATMKYDYFLGNRFKNGLWRFAYFGWLKVYYKGVQIIKKFKNLAI